MNRRPLKEMTLDEIDGEISWMESTFARYVETGQGISSKENIWHRELLVERDHRRIIKNAAKELKRRNEAKRIEQTKKALARVDREEMERSPSWGAF